MKRNNGTMQAVALILCLLFAPLPAIAKVEPPSRPLTKEQVQQSLGFIEKLLSGSSVAKHVDENRFAPAVAYMEEAKRLHRQAFESVENGNLEKATTLRDEAIKLIFEAGHLSHMMTDNVNNRLSDYDAKTRSIKALMEAYHNIAMKKGVEDSAAALESKTDKLLAQASTHLDDKDFSSAGHALNQAYSQLKAALDRVRGGTTLGELSTVEASFDNRYSEYDAKMRSLNAMLEAHQRIVKTKPGAKEARKLNATINPLLEQAQSHATDGEYGQALAAVDYAYTLVTSSIEKLRGGETLVRTLKFETKEEEYHYELDRNDTYRMLITTLINDKETITVTPRIESFINKAATLRQHAEEFAGKGDFERAITLLEEATRNLIFAMRNAGFFVPG